MDSKGIAYSTPILVFKSYFCTMKSKFINIFCLVLICSTTFLACKSSQKDLLCKKWKTVALKNSKMEQEVLFMQQYIDTLGQNDPELKTLINIDSTKMMLKAEMEKSTKEQQLALENTLMEFKSNGVAYTTSIDGVDSAMFTIEENFIKIDEAKLKGVGETMTFEILNLTKDSLKLQMIDYGDTSVVLMIPTN